MHVMTAYNKHIFENQLYTYLESISNPRYTFLMPHPKISTNGDKGGLLTISILTYFRVFLKKY